MKSKLLIAIGLLVLTMGLFVGVVAAQDDAAIQGGLLYDKWWVVVGADEPTTDHPLWATQSTNTRSGKDTWRCKECHGWDYQGADGAYGSGSHFTGFPGVYAARDKSADEIVAALKSGDHDFSAVMDDAALANLAAFIKSVGDYKTHIDYGSKASIGGDAANGQVLYESDCAGCHGDDGTDLNFGSDDDPAYVGAIATGNPQEFLHKALYGHPGSKPRMPGGIENGWSMAQVVDVLAYAQSLPTGEAEAPAAEAPAPAVLPVSGGLLFDLSLFLVFGGTALLSTGLFGLIRSRKRA